MLLCDRRLSLQSNMSYEREGEENLINRRIGSANFKQTGSFTTTIFDEGATKTTSMNNYLETDKGEWSGLNLAERIFLLAIQDGSGSVSIWNEHISMALRGCFLIDLCLKRRIRLETRTLRRRRLCDRYVIVVDDEPTNDRLLDETLKHMKIAPDKSNVTTWLDSLNGVTWNPWLWRYHLRFVKERIAKDLVEKGVMTVTKRNYILFEMPYFQLKEDVNLGERLQKEDTPVSSEISGDDRKLDALEPGKGAKTYVVEQFYEILLKKWTGDVHKMDIRDVSLLMMAHAGDVTEEILACLKNEDYDLAQERMKHLLQLDYELEAQRNEELDVIWGVFQVLGK